MTTTLLIVDDHDAVRRSLRELALCSNPDIRCLEAVSGEAAVELAAVHRPDVVLMDISMPGISGIEATRRIKAASPETSIVIVSIFDTAAHRADAVAAGASAYVPKIDFGNGLPSILGQLLAAGSDGGGGVPAERGADRRPKAETGDHR